MKTFEVGQCVRCVDAHGASGLHLVKNAIYTIDVRVTNQGDGEDLIKLVGIDDDFYEDRFEAVSGGEEYNTLYQAFKQIKKEIYGK